jgi:signal transduction histidine kinase
VRRLLRPTVRTRLTALYAGVVAVTTAAILVASYELMDRHLRRTLTAAQAQDALDRLSHQYIVAGIGATLLAIALGWALADRALRPLARITATARTVSDERLGERIAADGPDDELRELAETFDAMLDRLEDAFDAQRRFVANASHELRSPLTVIRTEADVALDDPAATREELREALRGVLDATDRTESLLAALLLLARTQRELIALEPVDLADVARVALDALRDEVRAAGITVRTSLAHAPAQGDPVLIDRLVANLVENAVRHNARPGLVEVTTHREAGAALLRVTNTGAVLSAEDVARMTEPFERLGRRAGPGGSGLGLSIVRSVVDAHAGRLTLAAADGGGLEAQVRLPDVAQVRSAGPPQVPADRAGGSPAPSG